MRSRGLPRVSFAKRLRIASKQRPGARSTHRSTWRREALPNGVSLVPANLLKNMGAPGGHWRKSMLWTIFVVLLILWLLGFSLSIGGGLIHLLLVCALVVLVFNLVSGRRGTI